LNLKEANENKPIKWNNIAGDFRKDNGMGVTDTKNKHLGRSKKT